VSGFLLTLWSSVKWDIVVGGKAAASIPPYVVIAFELTILFGALATVIGLFVNSRLPHVAGKVIYDPGFSAGRFGIEVHAEGKRLDEARAILERHQPVEVRDEAEDAHA